MSNLPDPKVQNSIQECLLKAVSVNSPEILYFLYLMLVSICAIAQISRNEKAVIHCNNSPKSIGVLSWIRAGCGYTAKDPVLATTR